METKFKVGDKIEITEVGENSKIYFSVGDIGIIIRENEENSYYADFNNQGNKKVIESGCWHIGNNYKKGYGVYAQFKLYKEEKPRFHKAQPGDLLWNDELGICKIKDIVNSYQYPVYFTSKIITEDKITLEGKRFLGSPKATFFYYTPENHYLTERPEFEVDWSKVIEGTIVKVSDRIENLYKQPDRIFMGYYPNLKEKFWTFDCGFKQTATGHEFCKLA